MANALTGEFDVVAEFGMQAVNRVLAVQHQGQDPQVYFHTFAIRIDDAETAVRGTAQIQVSTPTVTLPAGENASKITIHCQLMAYMAASHDSAAVPEFVHGEIAVTLDVVQTTSETENVIAIDFGADDLEVTFTPDPGAGSEEGDGVALSDEETNLVNQIIREIVRTGFEPVNAVVRLPARGELLRVHHWRFRTMPDDQQPAVAVLLNVTDQAPSPEDLAGVTEVFLQEADDFAIAIGRDFLVATLLDVMRDRLPRSIIGTARIGFWIFGVTVNYSVSLDLDSVRVELGEGRIRLSVGGELTVNNRGGTFTVTQDFRLNADGDNISLDAPDDPHVDLDLNLPFFWNSLRDAH
ncbi:MAG: hypothetical protein M5R38_02800 [Candidatus Methylomirabilis sp.]|nr:hypothetical protein [Candidatus Methylomirabilis sp.]